MLARAGIAFGPAWTQREDDILRATYAQGLEATRAALRGRRTFRAIMQRARRLRITRKRHWTAAEDRLLSWLWDDQNGLAKLATRLRRTEHAVFRRAQDLGLKIGVPQGYESVRAAARRSGFPYETMVGILKAAHVRMRLTLSDPSRHGKARHRFVDPELVDDAVALWNSKESVSAAARRIGMGPCTLRGWLHEAGVMPPAKWKTIVRLETAVIDRVVAERRMVQARREPLGSAA